jgi:hypothetical protein
MIQLGVFNIFVLFDNYSDYSGILLLDNYSYYFFVVFSSMSIQCTYTVP